MDPNACEFASACAWAWCLFASGADADRPIGICCPCCCICAALAGTDDEFARLSESFPTKACFAEVTSFVCGFV